MPFPDALQSKPRIIFFTDFDGTITMKDTNDYMTDNHGFGEAKRKQGNKDTLEEKVTFRDSFQEMVDSWTTSIPETIEILKANIKLDPGFAAFYKWARDHNVPVIVLSSGMVPVIRAMLEHLVGPEARDIEVEANNLQPKPPINDPNQRNGWTIKFHDDSGFGHDKSLAIRPYAQAIGEMPQEEQPTLLYAGDGVSDMSAAAETDLLFAKAGHDLVTYSEREGIPFAVFEDWRSILETTNDIFDGRTSVKKVAAQTLEKVRSKE